MKKITFVALAALTITACSSGPKFQVNGDISGADGKMLYLEASGLEGIAALDSVKLKGEGAFSFKQPRPESPEFYRLRIDDKVINFSVDSIETLQIKAPYVDFSTAYTIEGSGNSNKIKELTLKQIALQKNVDDLLATLRNNNISHDIFEDSLPIGTRAADSAAPARFRRWRFFSESAAGQSPAPYEAAARQESLGSA